MTDTVTTADAKLFTIAGTSVLNGVLTFRFATGTAKIRAAVLKRGGHTDINLIDLPQPMTKVNAVAFLETQGVTAILPKSGRKAAEQTPEQIAAAESAKASAVAAKAAAKAVMAAVKAEAARVAAADAAFMANVTGGAEDVIDAAPDAEVVDAESIPA
jgi:hypothetical protein